MDGARNIYLIERTRSRASATASFVPFQHLRKFDATGRELWAKSFTEEDGTGLGGLSFDPINKNRALLVEPSGSTLYVVTNEAIRMDAEGTILWRVPLTDATGAAFASGAAALDPHGGVDAMGHDATLSALHAHVSADGALSTAKPLASAQRLFPDIATNESEFWELGTFTRAVRGEGLFVLADVRCASYCAISSNHLALLNIDPVQP